MFLKINDSFHDRFHFAKNMIDREQSKIKNIVIICQSIVSYVSLDYVCNCFVHYKKEIGIDLVSNIFLISGIDKKETIAEDFF